MFLDDEVNIDEDVLDAFEAQLTDRVTSHESVRNRQLKQVFRAHNGKGFRDW